MLQAIQLHKMTLTVSSYRIQLRLLELILMVLQLFLRLDDGDESNGDNNPTIITLASTSTIEVIKTATVQDVNNSEVNDVGDIITYTIVVSNTGYTTVNSLTLDDTLTDYNSASLSYNYPISFLSATSGSTSVSLDVAGVVVSFTASYTITQSDVKLRRCFEYYIDFRK